MTFKSTKIEHVGGDRYKVTGDLTIKATTKPVTLDVVKYGEFNDPMMGHRIGYAAQTKINRKEFGMNFDAMLDGKFVVSNDIQINIEGEILEAAAEPASASEKQEAGDRAR
jgi:polyisoprenoid-binding protein YceI